MIMYTPDGYMSAQLERPGRPAFASGDWFTGTTVEIKEEAAGYIAYCPPPKTLVRLLDRYPSQPP